VRLNRPQLQAQPPPRPRLMAAVWAGQVLISLTLMGLMFLFMLCGFVEAARALFWVFVAVFVGIGPAILLFGSGLARTMTADASGVRRGLRRLARWEEIEGVDWRDDGAIVRTGRGSFEIDGDLDEWRALAARCQAACQNEPTTTTATDLPAEQVAAWLGLAPGEELTDASRDRRDETLGCGVCVALVALDLLNDVLLNPPWHILLNLGLVLPALFAWQAFQWSTLSAPRVAELRARGDGLELRARGRWRRLAWGALLGLERRRWHWLLRTDAGRFRLPAGLTQLDRLLPAIRQAIAAREQGLALPRMTADVPDAAISLSAAQSPGEERGLSRFEDS
jgi:hypothetical protein